MTSKHSGTAGSGRHRSIDPANPAIGTSVAGQPAAGGRSGQPTAASGAARISRVGYAGLATVFLACVVGQVFLAGLAIFAAAADWRAHTLFVHVFELVPLIMLILAFVGRLPASLRWQAFGLFALIFLQYFTANIRFVEGAGVVAALHPVVALPLVWLAAISTQRAWAIVTGRTA